MAAPANKTPPEVEAEAVRLIREGRTRSQVSEATGVSTRVLSRIARDAGVEWARVGSGSHGTPEAMAKARGYQSEYQRNKRASLSSELLERMEAATALMVLESDPRRLAALAQSVDAMSRAYNTVTKTDQGTDYGLERAQSMLSTLMIQMQSRPSLEGARTDVQPDGSKITYIRDQAVIFE